MAHLLDPESGAIYPLAPATLVGRGPACQIELPGAEVSSPHAMLQWTGVGWALRDLGSKNGTFVDGVCLPNAGGRLLEPGARLGFGRASPGLVLADPVPALYAVEIRSRRTRFAERGLLGFAGETGWVSVWQDASGLTIEQGNEAHRLHPDDVFELGTERWRIYPAPPEEGTATSSAASRLADVTLHFLVNRAEEVVLEVLDRGRCLGRFEQDHIYVLLHLARARRSGEGWVEQKELLRQLRLAQGALDTAIYRCRQSLLELGLEGATQVVEVQRGQKRLGTTRFSIQDR